MTERTLVRTIGLVVKQNNPSAVEMADEIARWLADRNALAFHTAHRQKHDSDPLPPADLVVTLGGDGTIVSLSHQLLGTKTPIAGVNFGQVGFLAELSQDTWQQGLENALQHGIEVTPRMTLRYSLWREGLPLYQGETVNDVVLTRGKLARLVRLKLGINHKPFLTLRADGLILSTPTGSTGYAGSAGGPLLLPHLNSYVVAAICPFLSTFPPLVLNADTAFTVTVCEGGTDLYLTLDGQDVHHLLAGDELKVQGAPERFHIADMGIESYFTRLHRIGFVQEAGKH